MKTRATRVLDEIEYVQKERDQGVIPEDRRDDYFTQLLKHTYSVFLTDDGRFIKEGGAYQLYLPEDLLSAPDYFVFDAIIKALYSTFEELVIDGYENKDGIPGRPFYKNNYSSLKGKLEELKLI